MNKDDLDGASIEAKYDISDELEVRIVISETVLSFLWATDPNELFMQELQHDLAFLNFVQEDDINNVEQFIDVSYSLLSWIASGCIE